MRWFIQDYINEIRIILQFYNQYRRPVNFIDKTL